MPSAQRRLRDGAVAIAASDHPPTTLEETRAQISVVSDGIAALQSLEDLGDAVNDFVIEQHEVLWKRLRILEQQLEGKEHT